MKQILLLALASTMLAAGDPCPSFKLDADHLLKADEVKLIQKDIDQLRSDGAEPQIIFINNKTTLENGSDLIEDTNCPSTLIRVVFVTGPEAGRYSWFIRGGDNWDLSYGDRAGNGGLFSVDSVHKRLMWIHKWITVYSKVEDSDLVVPCSDLPSAFVNESLAGEDVEFVGHTQNDLKSLGANLIVGVGQKESLPLKRLQTCHLQDNDISVTFALDSEGTLAPTARFGSKWDSKSVQSVFPIAVVKEDLSNFAVVNEVVRNTLALIKQDIQ